MTLHCPACEDGYQRYEIRVSLTGTRAVEELCPFCNGTEQVDCTCCPKPATVRVEGEYWCDDHAPDAA